MDMLILVFLGVIAILLFWSIFIKHGKSSDTLNQAQIDSFQSSITSANQVEFSRLQSALTEKILTTLADNQTRQLETIQRNSNFQTEETAKQMNQVRSIIQEQLSIAVKDLGETTKSNLEIMNKSNQTKLDQINDGVQKRLDENFAQNLKSVNQVMQNLGHIQSSAEKMIESTKSIDKLNTIFSRTSSKSFGDFGEKYLESMLREHLSDGSWDKQVKLSGSSEIIDFTISIDGKLIGIDSKFPLTKYSDYIDADSINSVSARRDFLKTVQLMGDSIASKYPVGKSLDILFLYLPSDGMYNEVVNDQQTVEYLLKRKVTVSSPSTIFPLILLIASYQFKAKINENADAIVKGLGQVKRNIDGFRDEFRKLGDKIRQAQQNYESADKNLLGVEKNILRLEDETGGGEEKLLEGGLDL